MSLRFPKAGDPDAVVGQTPWSARVPLDPLLASEIRFIQTQQADVGVGCGPGGPPKECKLSNLGKTKCDDWQFAQNCAVNNRAQVANLPHTR
jgi:hypothetical protein